MAIALNKSVSNIVATAGAYTLTLSDVEGILVGMKADVSGFMTGAWNVAGVTVTAVNSTTKTVQYSHGNATIPSQTADANFHLQIQWINAAYVATMLGFTPTGADATYLEECVQSSQDYCYRRRAEAGYNPHPGYPAGNDVKQGTGLYAMALYRERGSSGDTYAAYDSMGQFERPVTMSRILQLLGCGRAQLA